MAVDHKTESGINPATQASDKLLQESLDYFIPTLWFFHHDSYRVFDVEKRSS